MDDVENRLALTVQITDTSTPTQAPATGFKWDAQSWIATNPRAAALALAGSYYPDHVVFLGPALPAKDHAGTPPAIVVEGTGVLIRDDVTPSQQAMLKCLSDLLRRLPTDWSAAPIGKDAEAELLNWDAEIYRQALAVPT